MSISLIRVGAPDDDDCADRDDSEIKTTLPIVLGRGSLLKCGDKKISRRHAYLDWDDDGVMLTSVHQNSTFIIVKGIEKVITEGDTCLLSHGDRFGLLKTNFWYRISLPRTPPKDEEKMAKTKKTENVTTKKQKPQVTADETKMDTCVVNGDAAGQESKPTKKKEKEEAEEKCLQKEMSPVNKRNGSGSKLSVSPVPSGSDEANDHSANVNNKDQERLEENHVQILKKVEEDRLQTMTAEDLQMAVSSRKRILPSWLEKLDATKPSASKATATQHSHGGSRKSQNMTAKKKTVGIVYENSDDEGATKNKTNNVKITKRETFNDEDQDKTPSKKTNRAPRIQTKSHPKKRGSPLKKKVTGLHGISDDESDEGDEYDEKKTSMPKRKMIPKKTLTPPKKHSPLKHIVSDDESNDSNENNDTNRKFVTNKKKMTPQKMKMQKHKSPGKHDFSNDDDDDDESETAAQRNARKTAKGTDTKTPAKKKLHRQSCQYGANCYRKNPKHRSDFAHAGDSDFCEEASDSEDPEDDRPQCEYGIDCYRKNPQHRKDFRHSRIPQPQRRAKRKARQQKQGDDSDSDNYDFDDPFLNDGSSDDYAPTDSGSDSPMEADGEDEEDTKRMIKEGKKFMKKR